MCATSIRGVYVCGVSNDSGCRLIMIINPEIYQSVGRARDFERSGVEDGNTRPTIRNDCELDLGVNLLQLQHGTKGP